MIVNVGGERPEYKHGPAEVILHFLQRLALLTIDEEELVQPEVAPKFADRDDRWVLSWSILVLAPAIGVNVWPVWGIEIKP